MLRNRIGYVIAGILIISGIICGILSVVPVIDDSDYLIKISHSQFQIIIGVFFQFLMAVIYIGIAISFYSILREYNEALAFGFAGFRIIAGLLIIIGGILLFLFLILSNEFVKTGNGNISIFQTIGELLRAGRDFTNHVAMILTVSAGNIMLYLLFYKSNLVPKWISIWGLIGTFLSILASIFVLFRIIEIITPIYMILNIPVALLEIILAVWLIVKGFNFPHQNT